MRAKRAASKALYARRAELHDLVIAQLNQGPHTAAELSAAIGFPPRAFSSLLAAMRARGEVVGHADTRDHNAPTVWSRASVTASGLLEQYWPITSTGVNYDTETAAD